MKSLIPYLVFPGNCREVIEFYSEVLKGELTHIQTFGESPIDVPEDFKDRVFDSELKAENIHLKASDDLPNHPVQLGTNISMFVMFSDRQEGEEVFNQLAEGGNVLFPLNQNFGMLRDKFSVQWLLVIEGEV
ncbi:MAG: VOC family protein [Candidatus Kapaibacterium sp.]